MIGIRKNKDVTLHRDTVVPIRRIEDRQGRSPVRTCDGASGQASKPRRPLAHADRHATVTVNDQRKLRLRVIAARHGRPLDRQTADAHRHALRDADFRIVLNRNACVSGKVRAALERQFLRIRPQHNVRAAPTGTGGKLAVADADRQSVVRIGRNALEHDWGHVRTAFDRIENQRGVHRRGELDAGSRIRIRLTTDGNRQRLSRCGNRGTESQHAVRLLERTIMSRRDEAICIGLPQTGNSIVFIEPRKEHGILEGRAPRIRSHARVSRGRIDEFDRLGSEPEHLAAIPGLDQSGLHFASPCKRRVAGQAQFAASRLHNAPRSLEVNEESSVARRDIERQALVAEVERLRRIRRPALVADVDRVIPIRRPCDDHSVARFRHAVIPVVRVKEALGDLVGLVRRTRLPSRRFRRSGNRHRRHRTAKHQFFRHGFSFRIKGRDNCKLPPPD